MKQNKKITYKEISKAANVSLGTLSRYFNDGYVSKDKRRNIEAIIKKYNYQRNLMASSIRKKSENSIIIRTFASSYAQDQIIEGFISQNGKNTIVKYSHADSNAILESVRWALTMSPKAIVIFAPMDYYFGWDKKLKEAVGESNATIYGAKSDLFPYTKISFSEVFKKMAKESKSLDFVYYDPSDSATYKERLETIKKYFHKINIQKKVNFKSKNMIFFQNRKLQTQNLYESLKNRLDVVQVCAIDEKPIFNRFIKIDYFYIGIILYMQLTKANFGSKVIQAKIYKK